MNEDGQVDGKEVEVEEKKSGIINEHLKDKKKKKKSILKVKSRKLKSCVTLKSDDVLTQGNKASVLSIIWRVYE